MNVATYPGPTTPASHAFAVELPEGWSAAAGPGALMILTPDEHDSAFHPNVVISRNRQLATLDLKGVAARSLAAAKRLGDDAVIDISRIGRLHHRPTYIQTVSVTVAATGQRVSQLYVVFYGPEESQVITDAGESADLYTIVGTCLDADSPTYAPLFLRLATSFTFGPRLGVVAPDLAEVL